MKNKIDAAREQFENTDFSAELEGAELVIPESTGSARMSGYSVRMPTAVLEEARQIAKDRGLPTGAWLREVIEAAVITAKGGSHTVPISVLLAAAHEYEHRKAS
ncbi:hypothetical protein ACFXNW_24780 [Nocardia sp. NPDC059180]|uniref:hypothetical protein n=1 Tax=Nocardia sp. NPDC059180 TaxID=3346761 RepID=UPI00369DF981